MGDYLAQGPSYVTRETATVIYNNTTDKDAKAIKQKTGTELQRLAQNGEISQNEAAGANKYLSNDLASALARRNTVENNHAKLQLSDKKAEKLMTEAGLNVDDLYEASKFAGADYMVNYTKLTKEEESKAANGEITAAELKNIQNALNKKIKENGGDRVLNDKETTQLMEGLGLSVEKKFSVSKTIMGLFGVKSEPAQQQDSTVTNPMANAAKSALYTAAGAAPVAGVVSSIRSQANRREAGDKGGAEGGEGSVTNSTEAAMYELRETAAGRINESPIATTTGQPLQQSSELPAELPEVTAAPAAASQEAANVATTEKMPDGSEIYRVNGQFMCREKTVLDEKGHTLEQYTMTEKGETVALQKGEGDNAEYYDGNMNRITPEQYRNLLDSDY